MAVRLAVVKLKPDKAETGNVSVCPMKGKKDG